MAEELDRLIHRYLEGLLSEDEGRLLNERLKADPRARRRLAEMAFDTAQLPDVLEVEGAVRAGAPARRAWWTGPKSSLVAAAVILVAVGIALLLWPGEKKPAGPPGAGPAAGGRETGPVTAVRPERRESGDKARRPEVRKEEDRKAEGRKEGEGARKESGEELLRDFVGRVKGQVEGKGDERISIRIVALPGSADDRFRKAVGRLVVVGPGRLKDNESEGVPDPDHVAFLRKVKKAQVLELDLRHEGRSLVIAGLSEDQLEWARAREKEPERKTKLKERGGDQGVREEDR